MRTALVVSLVINAFLAFTILSNAVLKDRGRHHEKPHSEQAEMKFRGGPEELFSPLAFRMLPEEKRQEVREEIRRRLPQARENYREMSALRDQALQLLQEPEFDEAAFRETSRRMKELDAAGRDLMTDTMIDIIATLPEEDRIALVEGIEERREQFSERMKEHFKDRMDDREQRPDEPSRAEQE